MTPDLIALLLRESLPVRLALLDADPTGPGWHCWHDSLPHRAGDFASQQSRPDRYTRTAVEAGAAWLPANPLAIVRHAARIKYTNEEMMYFIRQLTSDDEATAVIERNFEDANDYASGPCPHSAAVALLREVVGG